MSLIKKIKNITIEQSALIASTILLIAMISYGLYQKKEVNEDNSNLTTYQYNHTEVKESKKEDIVEDIVNTIRDLKNDNTYVQIQTGDSLYESYMYNKNNECLAQTSDNSYYAVFRKDNKTIKYSTENSMIALGNDMDILTFSINAAKAVLRDSENITLLDMELVDEDAEHMKEYRVDLRGKEAVKMCYDSLGEQFADNMLDKLNEQMDNEWFPRVIMVYTIDNDNSIGIQCCYVVDNKEYLAWKMQGYAETDDWQLDSEWYTADFQTIKATKLDEMLTKLLNDTDVILDKCLNEDNDSSENTVTSETPSDSENDSKKNKE